MKKLLGIVVLCLLWCNVAYSQDCRNIDYKNNPGEFINCITKNKEKELERSNMILEFSPIIDFGCLNLCKDTVKGPFTISELNSFCMRQCALK